MLSLFEERIIVFQAPAQFPKIKMSRILLSITVNFGCSSYLFPPPNPWECLDVASENQCFSMCFLRYGVFLVLGHSQRKTCPIIRIQYIECWWMLWAPDGFIPPSQFESWSSFRSKQSLPSRHKQVPKTILFSSQQSIHCFQYRKLFQLLLGINSRS